MPSNFSALASKIPINNKSIIPFTKFLYSGRYPMAFNDLTVPTQILMFCWSKKFAFFALLYFQKSLLVHQWLPPTVESQCNCPRTFSGSQNLSGNFNKPLSLKKKLDKICLDLRAAHKRVAFKSMSDLPPLVNSKISVDTLPIPCPSTFSSQLPILVAKTVKMQRGQFR